MSVLGMEGMIWKSSTGIQNSPSMEEYAVVIARDVMMRLVVRCARHPYFMVRCAAVEPVTHEAT
jgi:hypothetical protein